MFKFLIILTISLKLLISVNAYDIYTNDIKPIKLYYEGQPGIFLDLTNAQIMQARFKILWTAEDEISQYYMDLKKLELKNKIKNYGIAGAIVIIIMQGVIISLK